MLGLISSFFFGCSDKNNFTQPISAYIVKYLVSWFILFDFLCQKLAGNWSIRITKENCRPTELNNPILDFEKSACNNTANGVIYFYYLRLRNEWKNLVRKSELWECYVF